ncbi:hypothetical protein L6164_013385 [Bauhinia variegata]|uniref:Uncharacterized protein n=1 Tax=Bauhinia variegata TaxID=167791 RepID=A0ACB9NFG2_BAUVA|nr:hypothetical protein L6164_013385 [Bauhinia variegata]
MVDGWTDKRSRTLINFLVNSPRDIFFMEFVNASNYVKSERKMFKLIDKFIKKGRHLDGKVSTFVLDFMCSTLHRFDVGRYFEDSMSSSHNEEGHGFVYNHPGLLNMMRCGPLIKAIYLVNGEKRPPISKTFHGREEKYENAFRIIDERWEGQLHRPLHAAAHFLDPKFFYANQATIQADIQRLNIHNNIDPICLTYIDESNEWLIGQALGVEEPVRLTRVDEDVDVDNEEDARTLNDEEDYEGLGNNEALNDDNEF